MSKRIHEFWPMKTPMRVSQKKVLEWIENLPSHIKYIIAEMPVGTGKSPVGINYSAFLSSSMGSSLVFTPQKILQNQYEKSFDSVKGLYGKQNYTCKMKNTTCNIGSIVKPECPSCPHKIASESAKASPNVVLNYKIGLLHALLGTKLIQSKRLFIFDECHTLENHLTEFLSINISEYACKKYGIRFKAPKSIYEALAFVETDYLPAVKSYLDKMRPHIERSQEMAKWKPESLSKEDVEAIYDYEETINHSELITSLVCKDVVEVSKEYALIIDKSFFKFKELYGRRIFNSLLDHRAEKMLFLSSTILDHKEFAGDIGLDLSKTAFISIDSEFSNDNRPVIYMPKAKMSYGWDSPERKHDRDNMIEAIKLILTEQHSKENGIIHTGSFQIANWLVKEVQKFGTHIVYHHGTDSEESRDEVINKFQSDISLKPKVLISPSITEGLDLVDNKARFAIFAKVPFPHLGDAWVKGRLALSQSWYNRQALISIIQGAGRVVRTPEDWGYTYILDETFGNLYTRCEKIIPKWWKDAYEVVN